MTKTPTGKVVTGFDLDIGIVTIDVPHGDALITLAAALGDWQARADRLAAGMAELRDDAPGVYLDPDGTPVVPGWYERKDGDRHVAWYLIWSHAHSRATGCKRRQYVRAAEVEAVRVKVARTIEYRDLAARRDALQTRIARLGRELAGLVEDHGLVTKPARQAARTVTTRRDNGMATKTVALGNDLVTTAPMATKPAHQVGALVTSHQ